MARASCPFGSGAVTGIDMRLLQLFLVDYFIQVVGVGLALWQSGIFERIPPIWFGIGALVMPVAS